MKRSYPAFFGPASKLSRSLIFALAIAAFVLGLEAFIMTLNSLGEQVAGELFLLSANPLVGVCLGMIATTILQRSSVTTAIAVGLVASGTVELEQAVYLVFGANIGTCLTSDIVSLGFITKKKPFRRAFSVAAVHDLYNLLITLVLFPLEYYFQWVSGAARWLSALLLSWNPGFGIGQGLLEKISPKAWLAPLVQGLGDFPLLALLAYLVLIFLSLYAITQVLRCWILDGKQTAFNQQIFGQPYKSFFWGMGLTSLIQSSSLMTSLSVPFAAANKISVRSMFPFIIGANLGTTLTALLAALYQSQAAIALAATHILFNLVGVLLFLPWRFLQEIPIALAYYLAEVVQRNRSWAFAYLLAIFFLLPIGGLFIGESSSALAEKQSPKPSEVAQTEQPPKPSSTAFPPQQLPFLNPKR